MFSIPRHYVRTLLVASHVGLAGLFYGIDTGSIGPITTMPQFAASIGQLSSTQQGIYVACVLLSAAFSSLAAGYVADTISRRYGIMTGGILGAVGTAISAASPGLSTLIVGRLLTGAGIGQTISVVTVYLVELAPKGIRGVTACILQLYVVLGIVAGYFITYGSQGLESSFAWRLPFIIQAGLAVILAAGTALIPFSPRWLMQRGRRDEARAVLGRLRADDAEADAEMAEIEQSLQDSRKQQNQVGFMVMFHKRYRARTSLGIFLMVFQQLTGIDAVLYYAPILFQQAGFSSTRATFLASGVSSIFMLLATIPAQIWIDSWGRKKPLIYGGAGMSVCLIVIGAFYARYGRRTDDGVIMDSRVGQWFVVVMIYLFLINFSWSWAVVGKIYSCEIIPTHIRVKVASVELLANWVVNFAVALSAPIFLRSSPSGPYFLYGFATLVSVVVCCFMPETKGRSLEEIERDFEKSQAALGAPDEEQVRVQIQVEPKGPVPEESGQKSVAQVSQVLI